MKYFAILRRRGLTLVELLVTVAITGILLAVAVPSMNDFLARQRLDAHVNELISDLAQLRVQTIGKQSSTFHIRLQIKSNPLNRCYVAYRTDGASDPGCSCERPPGSACSASSPGAEWKVVQIPEHHGITLSSNTQDGLIYYTPETNNFSPPQYRMTMTSARLGALQLSASGGGAIGVCSVGVKITGYPLCPA